MTTFLIIAAILGASIYFFTRKKNTPVETEVVTVKEEEFKAEPVTQKVETRVEAVKETVEEMEARLKKIANPDSEKPFAKISKPEISEAPAVAEAPAETPAPSEAPKKRKYKKRAPKEKKNEK